MNATRKARFGRIHLLAVALLWLLFARLLATAAVKSTTFDEVIHIFQGVLYWQYPDLRPLTYNPPLVNATLGLPVTLALRPALPLDHPLWPTEFWLEMSQAFLWQANANGLQIVWVARVAVMWLALLTAALVYRWGGQLWGRPGAGLLALLLISNDPNVLAHAGLATTDTGNAFYIVLAAYAVWRAWHARLTWRQPAYIATGVALGAALAAKFSGLIFLPGLAAIVAWRALIDPAERRRVPWRAVGDAVLWLAIGGLVFAVAYRFEWATLLRDWQSQSAHYAEGHSAFLFGRISREGWWYYFPVILAIKTPLPTLALVALALLTAVRRRRFDWQAVWPLLLAGGIVAAGMVSRVNLGYRYLLPALPLTAVFVGQLAPTADALRAVRRPQWRPPLRARVAVAAVLLPALATVAVSAAVHPDYLAYLNALVGGPARGWRTVADSNIDWGQDTQALAEGARARGITHMTTALFGGDPHAYGLNATQLPVWPIGPPSVRDFLTFYPPRPAAGWYAVSVTNWHGVYHDDPAYLAYFRTREPDWTAGRSILVYDVRPDGPLTGVTLAGITLPDVAAADYDAAVGTNHVTLRWADTRRAFVWPAADKRRALIGRDHLPTHPWLAALYPAATGAGSAESPDGSRHAFLTFDWSANPLDAAPWTTSANADFADPATGEPLLALRGYRFDGSGSVLTRWRVLAPPAGERRIFLHVLAEDGTLVAQHDGFDVRAAALAAGDEVAQLHPLDLAALPAGRYRLRLGVYDPATGVRLVADSADGVDLETFTR